jgi:hypothetical protein
VKRRGFLAGLLAIPLLGSLVKAAVPSLVRVEPPKLGEEDCTARIQAALDQAAHGGTVYFPAGRYIISAPLLIAQQSLSIVGDGPDRTVLVWRP